jgi:hypothetical protein
MGRLGNDAEGDRDHLGRRRKVPRSRRHALGGDDVTTALLEIYDDPRVKVPSKVFNADRKIGEDLPIHIPQK